MKIVFSEKCLEYKSSGHPESPARVQETSAYLREKGFCFLKEFAPAKEKDLLLVHSKEFIQRIKKEDFFDPDTPALADIFQYACLSAGAAIKAMELSLVSAEPAFSLMRPPGHHAGRDTCAGFCYFNNLAVAVQKAVSSGSRAAILDLDCHHGNGTEEIFLGKKDILYVSLHQVPLYPGTGLRSSENCFNYPLPAGTGEAAYLVTLKEAFSKVRSFLPQLLAVSMGFDTYKGDPLAQMGLEKESFRKIARLIASLEIPCFCVLEGGYSSELKYCIFEFLKGFKVGIK